MTPSEANAMPAAQFVAAFGHVFEHSPWVAERVASRRPFASAAAFHEAMMQEVEGASPEQQLALLRAHPELAGREASRGSLTADSTSEQARLGFTALTSAEFRRVADANRRYQERFGFPCIVALRQHASRDSVIEEMERRISNSRQDEIAAALAQIGHITRGRLASLFDEATETA